jgi:hypothetical protein
LLLADKIAYPDTMPVPACQAPGYSWWNSIWRAIAEPAASILVSSSETTGSGDFLGHLDEPF